MTKKEFRARYKYTIFGFLWLVVNPFLQMLVIGFIFSFLIKEPVKNYYYNLYIGLLIWNFFALSLLKATPSIVTERFLIKKSKFPRSVIPLSIVLSNLIHFLIGLGLFLIPVVMLGSLSLTSLPLLIFSLMGLISFTLGLSLLTSALNVRYRDVRFFVEALLLLWFYATPIIYVFSAIPKHYMWIWRLNPMTSIIQLFQYALLKTPPPGLAMISINFLVITAIVMTGIIVFNSESKNFDDWV